MFPVLRKSPIFAAELVPAPHVLGEGIKREPGENPGQSRCCETLHKLSEEYSVPLMRFCIGKVSERESVRRPAIIH